MFPFPEHEEIKRRPVRYDPWSTTQVNTERLPPAEVMRGMELCYREEIGKGAETEAQVAVGTMLFAVFSSLITWLVLVCPPIVVRFIEWTRSVPGLPLVVGMLVAVFLLMFIVGIAMLSGSGIFFVLVPVVLVPSLVSTAVHLMPSWRSFMSAILASLTVALFRSKAAGGVFINFYTEWALTDMRLTRVAQETLRAEIKAEFAPSYLFCAFFIAVVTLGPFVPSALAIIAIVVLVIQWRGICTVLKLIPKAWPALATFLSYRAPVSGAPGVWIPTVSFKRRIFIAAAISTLLYTTVSVALFCTQETRYEIKNLLLLAPAAVVLSNLVLFAALSKSLAAANRLREQVEKVSQNDERTWWQRHADRLRSSKHVALDPLGNEVREAEHLFIGKEPWLNFPILLHQSITHDHVYVCGRTGSGKTSIGLMLLLIQLIRGYPLGEGDGTDNRKE